MKTKILFLTLLFVGLFARSKTKQDYQDNSLNEVNYGFIENKGQIMDQANKPNAEVRYLLCKPGFNLQLRQKGFSYDTYKDVESNEVISLEQYRRDKGTAYDRHFHRVDVELIGCNPNAAINASGLSPEYFNFFTEGTSSSGISHVHYYNHVVYENIYPDIDLEFFVSPDHNQQNFSTAKQRASMEYQFVVHPGGRVSDIQLAYRGANDVRLEKEELNIKVASGTFRESIPLSYVKADRKPVEVHYISLGKNVFSFSMPKNFSSNSDLVIDPTPCLDWGTYYGGVGDPCNTGIVVDSVGEIYVAGWTHSSTTIATSGAYQTVNKVGISAFVGKLNPNLTGSAELLWGTYFSGVTSSNIAIDKNGHSYITGGISTGRFSATAGSYDTTYSIGTTYIAKFSAGGDSLLWGTYFTNVNSSKPSIAADESENVYVTGGSAGSNVATSGAYQTTFGSNIVVKFNPKLHGLAQLVWCTYYNAPWGSSNAQAMKLDSRDNVYVTGNCTQNSNGIATAGAYQTAIEGGSDAYVVEFNPSSTGSAQLVWGTYFGGTKNDFGLGIDVDKNNYVYISGGTASPNGIATAGAWQTIVGADSVSGQVKGDAFIAKFNPSLTGKAQLVWSTYYGSGTDYDTEYNGNSVAVDNEGNVYFCGDGFSTRGIATSGAYETTNTGGTSEVCYLAKFNPSGSNLLWGTYFGATALGEAIGLAIDPNGYVYLCGTAADTGGVATAGTYQTRIITSLGEGHGFVARFGCTNEVTDINTKVPLDAKLSIYPNPTKGKITLVLDDGSGYQFIKVIDAAGRIIYQSIPLQISASQPPLELQLDLGNQPYGFYFVQILSEQAIVTNKISLIK